MAKKPKKKTFSNKSSVKKPTKKGGHDNATSVRDNSGPRKLKR